MRGSDYHYVKPSRPVRRFPLSPPRQSPRPQRQTAAGIYRPAARLNLPRSLAIAAARGHSSRREVKSARTSAADDNPIIRGLLRDPLPRAEVPSVAIRRPLPGQVRFSASLMGIPSARGNAADAPLSL